MGGTSDTATEIRALRGQISQEQITSSTPGRAHRPGDADHAVRPRPALNAQIDLRLLVSPRNGRVPLAQVFTKLGITTRERLDRVLRTADPGIPRDSRGEARGGPGVR